MVSHLKISILVIDDDEVMRKLVAEVLTKAGYHVQLASSGEEALQVLKRTSFPVVVSDIRMLEIDGMAVLRAVKSQNRGSLVILMTGFGSMDGAIEAIREGAFDYISKPFKMDELRALVARAVTHWETLQLRAGETSSALTGVEDRGLIGKSSKIVEIYKTIARAAMSTSNILVTGESGTGKELVARAIFENSDRKQKRFVITNCAAVTEQDFENEILSANGGVLFLDEVSDLSPLLQGKLLRVVQDGAFHRAGSSEDIPIDLRVVAASHQDIEALVRDGKFREDLFYRLKVIAMHLPPLRERMEDLQDLISYFLVRYSAKNKKPVSHVSDAALGLLKNYSWPGNIRELEHAIERAVAMSTGPVLFPEDFPIGKEKSAELASAPLSAIRGQDRGSLEELEKQHILRVLQETSYNKSKASEVLGIDRATLYRKAQRYGIDLRGKS